MRLLAFAVWRGGFHTMLLSQLLTLICLNCLIFSLTATQVVQRNSDEMYVCFAGALDVEKRHVQCHLLCRRTAIVLCLLCLLYF